MEAVFQKAADVLEFTTAADRTAGEVVKLWDGRAGVVVRDIDYSVNPIGATQVAGEFKLTKTTNISAFKKGDAVYWDATNNVAVSVTGDFYVGVCTRVATLAAVLVYVDLNEGPASRNPDIVFFDDFLGGAVATDEEWAVVDVGDATEAVVADTHGGEFALTIAATSEAEDAVLYGNDQLHYDIDKLKKLEFRMKVTTPGTGVSVVAGMAGDHNLDNDTVAQHAWFRFDASMACKSESDDGTTDNDDKVVATLTTGVYYDFEIDFTDSSDVKFYVNGAQVTTGTTFDMSAYTAGLQPYFSCDKASGTGACVLTLDWVRITASR